MYAVRLGFVVNAASRLNWISFFRVPPWKNSEKKFRVYGRVRWDTTDLSWVLNSSSMSSSSQLSSHNLSPPTADPAVPALARLARSVCESSQSDVSNVEATSRLSYERRVILGSACVPWTGNSSNSSSSSRTPRPGMVSSFVGWFVELSALDITEWDGVGRC